MNKSELISKIAEKSSLTKKDAEKVFNAFVATIEEALLQGDKVQLMGFGSFEVRERKARVGRNPQTNEPLEIPASKVPAFKAGKNLKNALN